MFLLPTLNNLIYIQSRLCHWYVCSTPIKQPLPCAEQLILANWHCSTWKLIQFQVILNSFNIKDAFFLRQHHDKKGHKTCVSMFIHKIYYRRQKPTTIVLKEGHLTEKSDDRVEHLNTILAQMGRNLNDPIGKSSDGQALPWVGGGGCWDVQFQRIILSTQ